MKPVQLIILALFLVSVATAMLFLAPTPNEHYSAIEIGLSWMSIATSTANYLIYFRDRKPKPGPIEKISRPPIE